MGYQYPDPETENRILTDVKACLQVYRNPVVLDLCTHVKALLCEIDRLRSGELPANKTLPAPEQGPKDRTYYRPQENPIRYPLELNPDGHICLWNEDGKYKFTIAYLDVNWKDRDVDLKFVSGRPLDERVNWDHFREVIEQGYRMMARRMGQEESA